MIIAVAADLHLNNSTYGKTGKNGLSLKTQDALDSFVWIVDECLERKVDRLVVVGDVFDNHYPTSKVRDIFNREIQRLTSEDISVLLMVGNHDICSDHHALLPLGGWDEKVTIIDTLSYEKEEDFVAAYLPHTFDVERRNKTFRDYISEIQEKLSKGMMTKKFLFFGHFGVNGSMQNDNHQNTNPDDVSVAQLESLKPDAAFLGHYHKRQKLSDEMDIYYVGSHERHNFSERDQEKGFVIYDTSDGGIEFVNNNAREMVEISGETIEDIIEQIEDGDFKDKIVRVFCAGDKDETSLIKQSSNALKKLLNENGAAHYIGLKIGSKDTVPGKVEIKQVKNVLTFIKDRIREDHKDDPDEMNACLALFNELEKRDEK